MIRKLASTLRTPIFSNTGSTARDHLASERTFLAWIWTGLGFIALGIAVERFSQLDLEALTKSLQQISSTASSQSSHTNSAAPSSTSTDSNSTNAKSKPSSKYETILVPALLGTGTGSIVYGTSRYFTNLRLIERGLFTPAYHGVAVLSVSCAAMAGVAYWGMLRHELDHEQQSENHLRHVKGSSSRLK